MPISVALELFLDAFDDLLFQLIWKSIEEVSFVLNVFSLVAKTQISG